MKKNFTCPHCDAVLNPSVKILLTVSYRNRRGMILLSPQPGNFKFILDKTVEDKLKVGSKVKFEYYSLLGQLMDLTVESSS